MEFKDAHVLVVSIVQDDDAGTHSATFSLFNP